jgi:catechol 2,3-dioxygenase-like lactoylglutathione lyase family enzyme
VDNRAIVGVAHLPAPDAPRRGDRMNIEGLNHVTLRCRPLDLPALHRFYVVVLGLAPGWRPPFPFAGYWMYPPGGKLAAIHVAATRDDASALDTPAQTGFDHLSLTAVGLSDAKARLQAHGVPFDQVPVPGADIMQLFLRDPLGVRIELTFLGER